MQTLRNGRQKSFSNTPLGPQQKKQRYNKFDLAMQKLPLSNPRQKNFLNIMVPIV